MMWVLIAMVWSAVCYGIGYFVRGLVENSEAKQYRNEMGLEDEDCKNCKDLELPCDPKCKFRKENEDEQSEKNNSEEN